MAQPAARYKHRDRINAILADPAACPALSMNPAAVETLLQQPEKIDWYNLSGNENPLAVEYLLDDWGPPKLPAAAPRED